jgi:hypothetical protein
MMARLGNAIYVTAIALAIFCFILALLGMGSTTVRTPLDMAIYVACCRSLFACHLGGRLGDPLRPRRRTGEMSLNGWQRKELEGP